MIGKALDIGTDAAAQRVIGYSKSVTKTRKNKVTTESYNIGIQAWELGILLAAAAVYDYVNGPGTVAETIKHPVATMPFALPPPGSLAGLP